MSVSNVGSPGPAYVNSSELEGDFTSVAGRLAVLMLHNEETQEQIDRDSLSSARERYAAALAREVSALREQADGTRLGAIVTGSLGLASAGLDVWGVALECKQAPDAPAEESQASPWQGLASRSLDKIAQPLGTYVSHNFGAATAKAAQGDREQASWEVEDLRKEINESDSTQDKVLEWVSGIIGQDAAVTSAILSNKV